MSFQKYTFSLILCLLFTTFLNAQQFGFNKVLKSKASLKMPFAIKNTSKNRVFLSQKGVTVKAQTKEWLYITATPEWISTQLKNKAIQNFYFEYAPPTLLDDSARAIQHVNEVQQGVYPLLDGYTGKDVIVGVVDAGLDHNQPDFITANGTKRVIRYWDQSITNPTQSPQPYGYGQIWYQQQIQDGACTSNEEAIGHGTSVTGNCAGNGLADGRNKGMAPDAQIIFVETNFNLPNWTLTVADACDYIFRVADSLHKPAVINLSLGSYLGSHDGRDPAAVLMEHLVQAEPGRIIVGAAGNGGDKGKYHAQQSMSLTDTNFIWFKNNPNSQLGDSTIFFDLWSDVDSAQFYYSFGANRPTDYSSAGATAYRFAQLNVGTVIYDTIRNSSGDAIAKLEIYTEYMNGDFHLQGFFSKLDSLNYLFRFSTTGKGKYDLWSGKAWGLNEIVDTIPPSTIFPPITNYVKPDNLQSIVSSWNCSPNIISVANLRCRLRHIDHNGDYYYSLDTLPPGIIAPSSSRGPSRTGLLKPDISATGDISLGSAPLFMVGNPLYYSQLGQLGWHLRNGGTSMASPVVAGIAALYLERCPKSTYQDFINDMIATAKSNAFTGTLPNYEYGNGRIDAFDILKSKNQPFVLAGDTLICQSPVKLTANIPLYDYHWSNGSTAENAFISQADTVFLWAREASQGCKIHSDTIIVYQENVLPNPSIQYQGDSLVSSTESNYQWYRNGNPISGATSSSYTPTLPGYYAVAVQNTNGYCKSFSNMLGWLLLVQDQNDIKLDIYPNPANNLINIRIEGGIIKKVRLNSVSGQSLQEVDSNGKNIQLSINNLAKGIYFLIISTNQGIYTMKFVKM